MADEVTLDFIEKSLRDLSDEYQIPKDMIPQLIGLLKKHPDASLPGSRKGLKDGLEQQIENVKNQGILK